MRTTSHEYRIARIAVGLLVAIGACTDHSSIAGPSNNTNGPAQLRGGIALSSVVRMASVANVASMASVSSARASVESDSSNVVYVSLLPGTVPDGSWARIGNRRTGTLTFTTLISGGFDPQPVDAIAGDTIDVTVQRTSGVLLATWVIASNDSPPIVVSTDPPRGQTDVPINANIVVVFSSPLLGSTINASTVSLASHGSPVTGVATVSGGAPFVVVFTPTGTLAPLTDYTLSISGGVTDLAGRTLGTSTTLSFTTGTGQAAAAPASLTLTPAVSAFSFLGTPVAIAAVFRDAAGNSVVSTAPMHWTTSAPNTVGFFTSDNGSSVVVGTPYIVTYGPTLTYAVGDVGSAVITATSGTLSATANVTSVIPPGTSVVVGPDKAVAVGAQTQFSAQLFNAQSPTWNGGGTLNIGLAGQQLSWSSSDAAVARVDSIGVVTGVARGNATISATFHGITGQAVVTVGPTAGSAGTFVAVDSLHVLSGTDLAVISMADGTALVANGGSVAEVFDPATRKFTTIPDQAGGGVSGLFAKLQDGRVLFVSSSAAELYDPATRSFSAAEPPPPVGASHNAPLNATLLPNGKVLVLYGVTDVYYTNDVMPRALLFDPTTRAFTFAGPYAAPWFGTTIAWSLSVYSSALLPSGLVLINAWPQSQIYNPATNTFVGLDAGNFAPDAAILLGNGNVFFEGDNGRDDGYPAGAQLFDPATDAFSSAGTMRVERQFSTSSLLADGTVLILGGEVTENSLRNSTNQAETYDPVTSTFASAGQMLGPRSRHGAAVLRDGTVLIVGGAISTGMGAPGWSIRFLRTAELFIPSTSALQRRAANRSSGKL